MNKAPNAKRNIRQIALLAAILLIWWGLCSWQTSRLTPGLEAGTYTGFLKSMPPAREVALIQREGQRYIELLGQTPWMTLASSPPAYLFDTNALLVDWSMDLGADPRYNENWGRESNRTRITFDEAAQFFRTNGAQLTR